ncbi:MAG: hypothetical protein ACR2J3_11770 [Aridibacter sp.]
MNQTERNLSAEQFYRTSTIIWAALLMSQFMFLLVIYFAKPEVFRFDFSKPILGENAMLVIIFLAIALMNIALSFVLRNIYVNKAINEQNVELVQTAVIIGCALAEMASLFGLVLAFLNAYTYFFIFFIIGIAGVLLHFPLRKNFIDASYKTSNNSTGA